MKARIKNTDKMKEYQSKIQQKHRGHSQHIDNLKKYGRHFTDNIFSRILFKENYMYFD